MSAPSGWFLASVPPSPGCGERFCCRSVAGTISLLWSGAVGVGDEAGGVADEDFATAQGDQAVFGEFAEGGGDAFAGGADEQGQLLVGQPDRFGCGGGLVHPGQGAHRAREPFVESFAGQVGEALFEVGDAGGELLGDAQRDPGVGEQQFAHVGAAHQAQLAGFEGLGPGCCAAKPRPSHEREEEQHPLNILYCR